MQNDCLIILCNKKTAHGKIPCAEDFLGGESVVKCEVNTKEKTLKQRFKVFSLVDGTGLERIYADFAGYNSHIKLDYSSFFMRIFPKIGKKNTLEKSKVWSKVWSN